jgi:hypothetical protein
VKPEVVEQRLKSYKGGDSERETTVKSLFQADGCTDGKLVEQWVKGSKLPHVI